MGTSAWLGLRAGAATAGGDRPDVRPRVCLFTKCFQTRNLTQLAEVNAAVGHTCVDLTVRPGGHVLPERVREDLPRAHEFLARAGSTIAMLTTDITSVQQKHTVDVLRTAAELNIRCLKLGYYRYQDGAEVPALPRCS